MSSHTHQHVYVRCFRPQRWRPQRLTCSIPDFGFSVAQDSTHQHAMMAKEVHWRRCLHRRHRTRAHDHVDLLCYCCASNDRLVLLHCLSHLSFGLQLLLRSSTLLPHSTCCVDDFERPRARLLRRIQRRVQVSGIYTLLHSMTDPSG